MSTDHDRLVIRTLKTAIACAVLMLLQVVSVVITVIRSSPSPCACTPESDEPRGR